jgi:sulfur relay (sulfurtransferase) DsrC/TusE family protein
MDTKPWWQSKTIWGAIISALVTALSLFKINIGDLAPDLTTGVLGTVGLISTILVIVGRVKGAGTIITATKQDGGSTIPPARLFLLVFLGPWLAVALSVGGCAQGPVYPVSPVAVVGDDFQVAAHDALAAYAEYKAGNVNITWALQKMFNAYSLYAKSAPDVKALINAWTGNAGDSQELADRLARIFGSSPAPPETKMKALAQAAQNIATAKQ